MSNNKKVVNESTGKIDEEECDRSQRPGRDISINIGDSDSDSEFTVSQREHRHLLLPQHQQQQLPMNVERERNASSVAEENSTSSNRNERHAQSHFLSLFNNQLRRQRSTPGDAVLRQQTQSRLPSLSGRSSVGNINPSNDTGDTARNVRFWRDALRSFITHSSNIQYTALTNERSTHSEGLPPLPVIPNQVQTNQHLSNITGPALTPTSAFRLNARLNVPRSVSLRDGEPAQVDTLNNTARFSAPTVFNLDNSGDEGGIVTRPRNIPSLNETNGTAGSGGSESINSDGAEGQPNNEPEEINDFSELFVKFLTHFVRYLPFICIILAKFIHDHFIGILDVILLQILMYSLNKEVRTQVAKLSQKSFIVLLRDLTIVIFVVSFRLIMSTEAPDPFGLLIQPPSNHCIKVPPQLTLTQNSKVIEEAFITTPLPEIMNNDNVNANVSPEIGIQNQLYSMFNLKATPDEAIDSSISIGTLLYYVAVNDLILKLLTILAKLIVTLLPIRVIRFKARGRLYVLLEYISQFYRALAPIHQWMYYFFDSYSGFQVISGVLFSSVYLGTKGFELAERVKLLKKAFIKFFRNKDNERPPSKAELEAAGSQCPICHELYASPIALECGHVFCEACIGTWFMREQTCPMCRATMNDDPTYKDGFTTYFCQLF